MSETERANVTSPEKQQTTSTPAIKVEQKAESKERELEPWEEEMVKKDQLETGSGDLLARMEREAQLIDHSKDVNRETKTAVEEKKPKEPKEEEAKLFLDKAGDLLIEAADSLGGSPKGLAEGPQYDLNEEDFVYKAFDKIGDMIEKGAIGTEKTIRKMAELIKKIGKFNKNPKNVAATEASPVIVAGESTKTPEMTIPADSAVQPAEKSSAEEAEVMFPDEEFKLKRERYGYEERLGATALDPRKLVDKEGKTVIDPRKGKDFEYAYNSEANDFFDYLDKVSGKKPAETAQAPVPTGAPISEANPAIDLTQEAKDILEKIDKEKVFMPYIAENLSRILKENGISQEDINKKTPQELMEILKNKKPTETASTETLKQEIPVAA
jgi:hypothetical protein